MFHKLDQSLKGILVAALLSVPITARAVSDDVAVQLLERLNELEEELDVLRSENEKLRDRLDGLPTRSEEEEKLQAEADQISQTLGLEEKATDIEGVTVLREEVNDDIPALEDAAPIDRVENTAVTVPDTAEPMDSIEEALDADAVKPVESIATDNSISPLDKPLIEETAPAAANPAANNATVVTPVSSPLLSTNAASSGGVEADKKAEQPVDPKSKDSYYYYGTDDTNSNAIPAAAPTTTPAVTTATDTVPDAPPPATVSAGNVTEQKIRAEYNEAYRTLVSQSDRIHATV